MICKRTVLKKCGMIVICVGTFLLVLSFILLCRNMFKDLYGAKHLQKFIPNIKTVITDTDTV